MNKYVRVAVIILGIVFVGFIGRCTYMILCISCTSPPIKTYEYSGSVKQLEQSIQRVCSADSNINYKSRRDSTNHEDDGSRDLEIIVKKDTTHLTYDFGCKQYKSTTEIKLFSAFSENFKMGGYGVKAPKMDELLDDFENDFLVKLEKQKHVVLKPE